jgi:hypothetical protein
MTIRGTAAINPTLTNYAQGIAQDVASALADFLCPVVVVPAGTGFYKQYNGTNAFQIYRTKRAIGGGASRIQFEATDAQFNCKPNALEITIDDAEREAAGEAGGPSLEEAKARTLVSSAAISHEDEVLTVIKAGVAAVSDKGVWSRSDIDPVAQLDEQIEAVATALGMMPNRIAFGLSAWRVFRSHPKVLGRQPGAAIVGVTAQQAASMLINPQAEIRVGVLSKDSVKFGGTSSKTNIVGAEVFVFFGSNAPTQYDPSAFKTFRTRASGVDAVRMYRDESARSDVLAVDWSDQPVVASTAAVRRLSIT